MLGGDDRQRMVGQNSFEFFLRQSFFSCSLSLSLNASSARIKRVILSLRRVVPCCLGAVLANTLQYTAPENCVENWTDGAAGCSVSCGGGTKSQTFHISNIFWSQTSLVWGGVQQATAAQQASQVRRTRRNRPSLGPKWQHALPTCGVRTTLSGWFALHFRG